MPMIRLTKVEKGDRLLWQAQAVWEQGLVLTRWGAEASAAVVKLAHAMEVEERQDRVAKAMRIEEEEE